HWRYLWANMMPLRAHFSKKFKTAQFSLDMLEGKYVPVTKPFAVTKEYPWMTYGQTSPPRSSKMLKKLDGEALGRR
ncbi:hypothetical protein OF83DRAFT_1072674, partial [Amylostereum chailletii]